MKSRNRFIFFTLIALFFSLFNHAFSQRKSKTSRHTKVIAKKKELCTEVQEKIDSRLMQAIREKRGEKMPDGIEPAQVNADNSGNLQVDISGKISEPFLNKIKALGGKIIYPSVQYNTVRAEINLSQVETIAAFTEVKFIEPAVLATTQPVRPAIIN